MSKKKILLYLAYFVFVISIVMFSSTFAKYVSKIEVGGNAQVGELCLGYRRGNLYRNDILIIGVEEANAEGVIFVETLNFKPNDIIVYYFTINNVLGTFDKEGKITKISKYNSVDATYKISIVAKLRLPSYKDENGDPTIYTVPCIVTVETSPNTYTAADLNETYDLPLYNPNLDDSINTESVFLQNYRIQLEETGQLSQLDSKDYFGAELNIYITVTAEQVIPTITLP